MISHFIGYAHCSRRCPVVGASSLGRKIRPILFLAYVDFCSESLRSYRISPSNFRGEL